MYVLEVEPTEFPDGLSVRHKRKRMVKDDSLVFSLSHWNDEVAIN